MESYFKLAHLTNPVLLTSCLKTIGFLPVYKNIVNGFSIEDHTDLLPSQLAHQAALGGECTYMYALNGMATLVHKDWLPIVCTYCRSLYPISEMNEMSNKIISYFSESEIGSKTEIRKAIGIPNKTSSRLTPGDEDDSIKQFNKSFAQLKRYGYLCVVDINFDDRYLRSQNKVDFTLVELMYGKNSVSCNLDPQKCYSKLENQLKHLVGGISRREMGVLLGWPY